ncbi:MAG: serine/threonine-protein kinase, partial [Mycobacterium sp.]
MDGTPFGRYRLVELLGRGGMGEVWKAYDTAMKRVVAMKVLPPNFADDEQYQVRFRREAHAAAGLDEPHIVPIHDFGEIDDRLYVTMRLIDGKTVQQLLANGPLTPDRAVSIVEQIAAALGAAHGVALIHRDVKPANILVTPDDFAYLIDFGIARAADETKLTSTGATIGTVAYMAPERFTTDRADARSDIYALTCVLYECLTGMQPFPGDSVERQITGHLYQEPPRPSTMRAGISTQMDHVIACGMAKDPDRRFATTKDLATAARAALSAPVQPG